MPRFPDQSTLSELYSARWIPLTCPFCGKPAKPPLFRSAYARVSETMIHECDAEYFCDLDYYESSWDTPPPIPVKATRWHSVIIHNYNIFTSLVGFALNNDFDVMHPSAGLSHIIFRIKKNSKIERLGCTITDIHGEPATFFTNSILM